MKQHVTKRRRVESVRGGDLSTGDPAEDGKQRREVVQEVCPGNGGQSQVNCPRPRFNWRPILPPDDKYSQAHAIDAQFQQAPPDLVLQLGQCHRVHSLLVAAQHPAGHETQPDSCRQCQQTPSREPHTRIPRDPILAHPLAPGQPGTQHRPGRRQVHADQVTGQ